MQEQKVVQTFAKSAPKGAADVDVRRYRNKDVAGTNGQNKNQTLQNKTRTNKRSLDWRIST